MQHGRLLKNKKSGRLRLLEVPFPYKHDDEKSDGFCAFSLYFARFAMFRNRGALHDDLHCVDVRRKSCSKTQQSVFGKD